MNIAALVRSMTVSGILKMWKRNFKVYKNLFWQSMLPTIFEPVIYMVSLGIGLGLLIKKVEGLTYMQFIAPGLLASTMMFGASYETTFNTFVRLKFQKTYDAIMATPVNIEEIVAGEIFWGATRGFIAAAVFLVVIALFGVVRSPMALLLLPILFVSGLMFGVIGMTFTGLVNNMALFNYYFTIVVTPLFLFSGIFFPVSNLPGWAQIIAGFTPLYHVVNVSRNMALGRLNGSVLVDILYIFGVTFVLFLLPIYLMRRKVIK